MPKTQRPILSVLERDAFEYLSRQAPDYIDAIEQELEQGFSPEEIKQEYLREAGYGRELLAKRIEQAARYLKKKREG